MAVNRSVLKSTGKRVAGCLGFEIRRLSNEGEAAQILGPIQVELAPSCFGGSTEDLPSQRDPNRQSLLFTAKRALCSFPASCLNELAEFEPRRTLEQDHRIFSRPD